MDNKEREIQSLACFIHGCLCAFHGLGVIYNAKRKNWLDAAIHTVAATYDIRSLVKHVKACREGDP